MSVATLPSSAPECVSTGVLPCNFGYVCVGTEVSALNLRCASWQHETKLCGAALVHPEIPAPPLLTVIGESLRHTAPALRRGSIPPPPLPGEEGASGARLLKGAPTEVAARQPVQVPSFLRRRSHQAPVPRLQHGRPVGLGELLSGEGQACRLARLGKSSLHLKK